MQVTVGSPLTATLLDPPGGAPNLGARIEVPLTRAIVAYWRPAVLEDGLWTVETESPPSTGLYNFVWRTNDPEPPVYEVFFPLLVSASTEPISVPYLDLDAVKPTVEDVANLERTRAISEGGSEVTEFTDDTVPTYDDVAELIDQAAPLVAAEFPSRVPQLYYQSIRHAIALYTAALIEGSFFREQAGDSTSSDLLWTKLYNTAVLNLKPNIQSDLMKARAITGMESWRPDPVVLR